MTAMVNEAEWFRLKMDFREWILEKFRADYDAMSKLYENETAL
jgi:hypothetical protein